MRKELCFLTLLLLLSVVCAAQTPQQHVTHEKYSADYEVQADGTFVCILEVADRLNTKDGVKALEKVELPFRSSLQELEVLEAFTISPGGARVGVPASGISIQSPPQAAAIPSFDDQRVRVIEFPALQPGSAIFYKVKFSVKVPMFPGHFSLLHAFPADSVWKNVEINVSAPPGYELKAEAIDMRGGRMPDREGRARWSWRAAVERPSAGELAATSIIDRSPRLAVSSFAEYQALGDAYWAEAAKRTQVTPAVRQLADEITRELAGDEAYAKAIYEWVNRNLRYVSVHLGRGGYIPHDVDAILTNRYGDCKDYVVAYQSLLAAKGVESIPVLIGATDSYWFPHVATPDMFNHVLVYVPSLNLYIDPTVGGTRPGLLPLALVGRKALLAGRKTGVVTLPSGTPAESQLASEIEIEVRNDGSLKAESHMLFKGRMEMLMRPLLGEMSHDGGGDLFGFMLKMHGYEGSGKLLDKGNTPAAADGFAVKVGFDIKGLARFRGPDSIATPVGLSLMSFGDLSKLVAAAGRTAPLVAGAGMFSERYTLSFPAGIKVDGVPADVRVENPSGSYLSTYRQSGNKVRIERSLTIGKDVYPPQEYPDLKQLLTAAADDSRAKIRYSPTSGFVASGAATRPARAAKESAPADPLAELMNRFLKMPERLKPREVVSLEARLRRNPGDRESRFKLAEHYSWTSAPSARRKLLEHVGWIYQHHFEEDLSESPLSYMPIFYSDEEYGGLSAIVLKQVELHGGNPLVIKNAADFFSTRDPHRTLALLQEGQRLEPVNHEWGVSIARLYQKDIKGKTGEERQKAVAATLEEFEKALKLLERTKSRRADNSRGAILPDLARLSFESGDLAAARAYATSLLLEFARDKSDLNYERAMHYGNVVLGRLALKEGDLGRAKEHLMLAGKIPSAAFVSDGPDMTLAHDLLEKGERAAVIEYLHLCGGLWKSQKEILKRWEDDITNGRIPKFDAEP